MSLFRLLMFVAVVIFLVINVQLGIVSIVFGKLGLSQNSAYLLLLTTLLGSMINVPLFSVAAEATDADLRQIEFYRRLGEQAPEFTGRTVIAVNVGGAVTPVAFSLYLLLHNPLGWLQVIGVVAFVAAIAYSTSVPIRGAGIGIPILIAPLAAAFIAVVINPEQAAPLAYIGGTVGVLIGADLLHLGYLRKLGAPLASIGGAGTFDGIFLAGFLAVLLT